MQPSHPHKVGVSLPDELRLPQHAASVRRQRVLHVHRPGGPIRQARVGRRLSVRVAREGERGLKEAVAAGGAAHVATTGGGAQRPELAAGRTEGHDISQGRLEAGEDGQEGEGGECEEGQGARHGFLAGLLARPACQKHQQVAWQLGAIEGSELCRQRAALAA